MLQIEGGSLSLEQIEEVALGAQKVQLSESARVTMARSRAVIERIVSEGKIVYGVNTGFGRLSDVHIPDHQLDALQLNLVRSHACGVGRSLPRAEVRAMMLLRANGLSRGHSGARPELADLLVGMLNAGVTPVVPEQGSVGASGDLAPLAHLALVLIGEGKCSDDLPAGRDSLAKVGLAPIALGPKEGLALLNGTQAMVAVGGLALARASRLALIADEAGALTLEALLGTPVAFDSRIHEVRPQSGQIAVARHLCDLIEGSQIRESHRLNDKRVQDAYSLRCMPQVHGAVRDALAFARQLVEIESGSSTDNPLVFADSGEVLSGGNFHGAPLALAFDVAAIALVDLMSISERRIDRLVNPDSNEGLPAFLARDPGTSSGLMIAHVTAAALLSESKILAHPASVDSIPTSGGKEDHVSMGMAGAVKLRKIVENAELLLAIELICGAEGLEYRRPLRAGNGVERTHAWVRQHVAQIIADRPLSDDIERLASSIKDGRKES